MRVSLLLFHPLFIDPVSLRGTISWPVTGFVGVVVLLIQYCLDYMSTRAYKSHENARPVV